MRAIPGICLLLVLAACAGEPAPPPEMTNAERGQIQAEILTWTDQWLDAAVNLDAHGLAALFDQADGHFMRGASYEPTWQAFFTGSQDLYSSWDAWDGQWGTRRIDVLAPDAALFVGETVGLVRYSDGREFDNRAGFSIVVRKREGAWTGLFGHVTGSLTPRE